MQLYRHYAFSALRAFHYRLRFIRFGVSFTSFRHQIALSWRLAAAPFSIMMTDRQKAGLSSYGICCQMYYSRQPRRPIALAVAFHYQYFLLLIIYDKKIYAISRTLYIYIII